MYQRIRKGIDREIESQLKCILFFVLAFIKGIGLNLPNKQIERCLSPVKLKRQH